MRTNLTISVMIGILLLLVLPSCGSSHNRYVRTPAKDWIESAGGQIDTWNPEKLQKIVHFKIVLPKYLPEELKALAPHLIKLTGESPTDIRILYQTIEGEIRIDIEEVDMVKNWMPNLETEYTYLDISGVRILEDKLPDLNYMWNRGNISFSAVITGYNQDEARKIIESMINQ